MSVPRVGVGALLFDPDGSILIGHRVKSGERATWCLPGGYIEPKETPEEAARREIDEEAGLRDVHDATVFALAVDLRPTGVTIGVQARCAGGPVETGEPDVFEQWIWAQPHKLPKPLFPASRALLDAWLNRTPASDWAVYRVGPSL